MKLDNFLPVSRQLQKHWIYKDSSYLHCWLEMLFNARFSTEPKTDVYKGVLYTINRGEFLYSRPTYSDRLKITEGKLRTLIKLLVSDGMIEEVKSLGNNKPTIYKIINYDSYNSQPSEIVSNTNVERNDNQVETKSQPNENQVETKSQPLKNNVNTDNIEIETIKNICVFDYWQSKKIHVHRELSDDIEKQIEKLTKKQVDDVVQAIDNYSLAYFDDSYYYNIKWTLDSFIRQKNGYKQWLEEGKMWVDYCGRKSKPQQQHSDGTTLPKVEIESIPYNPFNGGDN